MVHLPLANGGSNSTIPDQVLLCHIEFFKGGFLFFISDGFSILRNYTLSVYKLKMLIHNKSLGAFHLVFSNVFDQIHFTRLQIMMTYISA